MQFQDMVTALMEARRKAQLEGRPLSAQETQGITGGYFQNAAERNLQGRQLDFQEKNAGDQLALERWKTQQMMNSAESANKNQMLNNILRTGGSIYGNSLLRRY